jgi:hypothetical protein
MSCLRLFSLMIVGLATALTMVGCSNDTTSGEATGSLDLTLELAPGVVINEVKWVISRPLMEDMKGTIDTSAPGATASVEVFGLPPGDGYTVTLTAMAEGEDTPCIGSADFSVVVGISIPVMVMLNCKRPERYGGVRVNGKFNICAELAKVSVSPLQTSVGNDIDLSALAQDVDDDQEAIRYRWTATGGTIANPTDRIATYTCEEVGDDTIVIRVSDDPEEFGEFCMDEWDVDVTCVLGDEPECEINDDCDSGDICFENVCRPDPDLFCDTGACIEDTVLRAECVEKFLLCLAESINEEECIALSIAICDVGCDKDSDCDEGEVCIANECVSGGGVLPNFETSLHNTRAGQEFWYRDTNGGFEGLINVEYDELTCQGCHNKADDAWQGEPSCGDCHGANDKHLQVETCLGCHGRQKAERGRLAMLGRADVHTNSDSPLLAKGCASCHGLINGATDVHGNGTAHDSLLEPGAIVARCEDCHDTSDPDFVAIDFHAPFGGSAHTNVDCSTCHMETVISCINCHFDEEVDNGLKIAGGQIFDWKFIMKWEKDGAEKYHPATVMTLEYDCAREGDHPECADEEADPKKTFAVFAPFYGHTITEQAMQNILDSDPAFGTDGCGYCHGADNCDAITGADPDNKLKLIAWDGATLTNPIKGLIPLPDNYQLIFEMDFAEIGLDSELTFFETGPDLWQTGVDIPAPMNYYGRPLTEAEFSKFCP